MPSGAMLCRQVRGWLAFRPLSAVANPKRRLPHRATRRLWRLRPLKVRVCSAGVPPKSMPPPGAGQRNSQRAARFQTTLRLLEEDAVQKLRAADEDAARRVVQVGARPEDPT